MLSSAIPELLYFYEISVTMCKLISLNVRGIGNFKKRRTIFTVCRKQKADFIFLQETHSKKDSEICWKNEWDGEVVMAHGSSNSRGMAILVRDRSLFIAWGGSGGFRGGSDGYLKN